MSFKKICQISLISILLIIIFLLKIEFSIDAQTVNNHPQKFTVSKNQSLENNENDVVENNSISNSKSELNQNTNNLNIPWKPGDPLPDIDNGNDNQFYYGSFAASGNQYYQSSNYGVLGGDGSYYVLKGTVVEDIVGSLSGDVGPNGSIHGELCPYIKQSSSNSNNTPSNIYRNSGCDYINGANNGDIVEFNNLSPNFITLKSDYTMEVDSSTVISGLFDTVGNYPITYLINGDISIPISDSSICTALSGTLSSTECNTSFANVANYYGLGGLGLPVTYNVTVVDDTQIMAANDIKISEAFAPKTDLDLLKLSSTKYIEPENVIDRNGANHAANIYDYSDGTFIINTGNYDYKKPKAGTYNIKITGISPTTGFETSRVITLDITPYNYGDSQTGSLLASSPVTITNDESMYDALLKANPITVIYKNGMLDYVFDETADEDFFNLSILQSDNKDSVVADGRSFYLIGTNHDGMYYQTVLEVQQTWNGKPITDEITIEAIDNLTVQDGYNFDPIKTTNAHAYNSSNNSESINVRATNVSPSSETNGQDLQQLVLESHNNNAYAVKLINVDIVDVENGDMPLLATKDARVHSTFTPKNEQQLLDLMVVKAVDVDGSDITDQVKIVSLGGFSYGSHKITDAPYTITFSLTSPFSGITITTTKHLSVVEDNKDLIDFSLISNEPIYIKLADGTQEEDITNMLAPNLLVYKNNEYYSNINTDITLLNNDGYDNNQVGTYYFLYNSIYTKPKQEIETLFSNDVNTIYTENIFEVIVTDQIAKTQTSLSINTPENIKVKTGDNFDPLAGVTANSITDGDITTNIEVLQNKVNTNKPGEYEVVYHVSDSTGQESYKNVTVTVYDSEKESDLGSNNDSKIEVTSKSDVVLENNNKEEGNSDLVLTNTSKTTPLFIIFILFSTIISLNILFKKFK